MAQAFDDRVVRVTIETENGKNTFEDLYIRASGSKTISELCNKCEVNIINIKKDLRDFIITETSPYRPVTQGKTISPKTLTIDVGRKSTGTFRLYEGDVIASNITQPPDIGITLKSLTGISKAATMLSNSGGESTRLSSIAQTVANDIGVKLDFQATDKNINNYNFTGGARNQIQKLAEAGNIDAFQDDDILYVKDKNKPIEGGVRVINSSNGMIGIPQVTEQGVFVKMFVDNTIKIGGEVRIESELNPAANGDYLIYKLSFDVSNRDNNFYYLAHCRWKPEI